MSESHHHKARRDSAVARFLKFPEHPDQAKMLMDHDRDSILKFAQEVSKLEAEKPHNEEWQDKMTALKGCIETRERFIKVYEEVIHGPNKSKFY